MNLDEDNPCPHCGNIETITDRTDDDFKPVIPKDLQYDFQKEVGDQSNIFIAPTAQEIYGGSDASTNDSLPETGQTNTQLEGLSKPPQAGSSPTRVSQDIPLESLFPTLDDVSLDPASQKVYFQLSIEFQIILNKTSNYRQGLLRWNLLLPDRLQEYGLTEEAWEKIAAKGDSDEKIQEQLNRLLKSIFE
ncbi:MAG: hypothetical protein ACFFAE_07925 [Candidatus Hodarchaeota archaeon]